MTALKMAPTAYKVTQNGKDKTKLRKPVVEKIRRDRINRCIEQLKALLKRELKAYQPCSKLEKADVLEMAVTYLKSHESPSSANAHAQSYAHGYSRCIEETARFLSLHKPTKPFLMGHTDNKQHKVSAKSVDSCQNSEHALWRPW